MLLKRKQKLLQLRRARGNKMGKQNYIREIGYEEMSMNELKSIYVSKAIFLNKYLKKNFPTEKFNERKPTNSVGINNIPKTKGGLVNKIYEVDRRINVAQFAVANIEIFLDFINNLHKNYRNFMRLKKN